MASQKSLQKQIQAKAQETVMKLMQDDRTRPVMAKAMQAYMEGRQRVDQVRDEAAKNLGLATTAETQKLQSRVKKLERQLEKLTEQLAKAEAALSGGQAA